MKNRLIDIAFSVKVVDPLKYLGDILAVGVFSDADWQSASQVDKRLSGILKKLKDAGDFDAKPYSTALIYSQNQLPSPRILWVGLGKQSECNNNTLRKAVSIASNMAVDLKAENVGLLLPIKQIENPSLAAQSAAEGAFFGAYRYDEYISKLDIKRPDKIRFSLIFSDAGFASKCKAGVSAGIIVGASQNIARTIANQPPNEMTPKRLADIAKQIAAQTANLKCRIFDSKQLAAKKMNGILSVGQGSSHSPALIVLHYKPNQVRNKTTAALVGKAITFDSGGISLKPGEGMHDMKFDKSGGAAVLCAMQAVARLRLPIELYGLIPSAENMPSGASYRPGDIVTTFSGKSVEIQNTDAEGRMLLADAIAYAKQLGCKTIIDIATLTGACVVAVGQKRAGLMGNNSELIEEIKKAALLTGERVWHLPCDEEFVEQMKSKIADLKNIGSKWGAACAGAAFLSQFAEGVRWAHLDIAGPGVWGADEKDPVGSVGFGVRLLTGWAASVSQNSA